MTPIKKKRTDQEFRRIVDRAVAERVAAAIRAHDAKRHRRDWFGSLIGLGLIGGGIAVFIYTNHAKGAEWVALALIVIGAGLFDRKAVTGLLKARFSGGGGSAGVTGEFQGGM